MSAPHDAPPEVRSDLPAAASPEVPVAPSPARADWLFCEFFAGLGGLTAAMRAAGVQCRDPDEAANGGTDFSIAEQVSSLKDELRSYSDQGYRLCLHFAIVCATFTRARDRRASTRLRSMNHPEGIPPQSEDVLLANLIAKRALELACWAHRELGAVCSVENPDCSYLWLCAELWRGRASGYRDLRLSYCRFGAVWRKHTRIRFWGAYPSELALRCVTTSSGSTCGLPPGASHEVLEFGGRSTSDAAAYPAQLCTAWADWFLRWTLSSDVGRPTGGRNQQQPERLTGGRIQQQPERLDAHHSDDVAGSGATPIRAPPPPASEESDVDVQLLENQVQMASSGQVHRHASRGTDPESAREQRERENRLCRAGLRDSIGSVAEG